MVTIPSHHGDSQSWILQSPMSVEGRTWKELRDAKLDPNGVHGQFFSIIKEAIGNGKHILDVGAADCCMTCCIVEGTENTAIAIDIVDDPILNLNAEKMIELAGLKDRVKFQPGINATFRFPFEKKVFDVSTAIGVLEHVWCPGHHNVIENMIKVSREKCIFLVPGLGDRWIAEPYTEGAGHINLFDEYRVQKCFGHYPYAFEIYKNKSGMGCWVIIMNLKKKRQNQDKVEVKEI